MNPQFIITNSETTPWLPSEMADGVEVKDLGTVNGRKLYRFGPNKLYPDHIQTIKVSKIVQIEPNRAVLLEINYLAEYEIDVFGISVGRQSHQLVLSGVDSKARKVGKRRRR